MHDTDIYDEDTDTYYGLDYVDEDDDFDRYHCVHGTYIGTPGGPDILCGWCEEGISPQEHKEIMQAQRAMRTRERAKMYAFQAYIEMVYPTFKSIPGGFGDRKFREWADSMRAEIDAMTPSDLLLIEEEVYR